MPLPCMQAASPLRSRGTGSRNGNGLARSLPRGVVGQDPIEGQGIWTHDVRPVRVACSGAEELGSFMRPEPLAMARGIRGRPIAGEAKVAKRGLCGKLPFRPQFTAHFPVSVQAQNNKRLSGGHWLPVRLEVAAGRVTRKRQLRFQRGRGLWPCMGGSIPESIGPFLHPSPVHLT